MSGYSLDANILIDALLGFERAHDELKNLGKASQLWISRIAWIEVMSKGDGETLRDAELFLTGFRIDELDDQTARRAATLRRERPRLKSADAIILSSAQIRGRILVTRNTKDFPADMPGIRIPYTI